MKASRFLVLAVALVASAVAVILMNGGCSKEQVNPVASNTPSASTDSANAIIAGDVFIPNRLAADPRQAVILELYYSLSTAINGSSTKTIGPWAVGSWNYLANDMNAYNVLKGWYGSYSSTWSLFFSSPGSYGFYGSFGRGGQCVYFANLVTYRSGVYQKLFPSYAACLADYNSSTRRYTKHYRNLRPGDIIRTFGANGHTAIVVAVLAGTPGSSVTSVDVIDANFVGSEIIGRHIISTSGSGLGDLDNYYAVDLIALGGR